MHNSVRSRMLLKILISMSMKQEPSEDIDEEYLGHGTWHSLFINNVLKRYKTSLPLSANETEEKEPKLSLIGEACHKKKY